MRKKLGVIVVLWLAGAVWIGSGGVFLVSGNSEIPVVHAGKSAADIQKEIEKKNAEQKSAKEEKKELEEEIAAIEEKKGNIEEYIAKLDEKLSDLQYQILSNEKEIAGTKEEITALKKKKKEAEKEKALQYETMKKRIKYMYENGSAGYFELILESESLAELFNRTEYVNKVMDYDKSMLSNYQKTCDKIAQSQKKIEKELSALENMRESLKVKQDSVQVLADKKEAQAKEYNSLLQEKNNNLSETESMLAEQEEELEKLIAAQRAKAEEERKKEEESKKKNETEESKTTNASGYVWPLTVAGRISSYFGYRDAPTEGASTFHKGIDIAVPVGTGVLATNDGTVVTATYSASAGYYVAISHGNGVYSYYMHCSSYSVSVGQKVSAGQQIALSGNTGISTGPHLHFAIYANGDYVNPLNYVS